MKRPSRFAAVDQGTTSTRLLMADVSGNVSVEAGCRHRTSYPQPGWVEQDAEELLANIRTVLEGSEGADAIGLANQGESCLAWDGESGEPLSPVVVWQDTRTADCLRAMERDGVGALVRERSGLPLDPYFSATKLAWILRNCPRAASAQAKGRLRLGTTDAFFLDRLTGRFVTDRATASRTGLMNIATGAWDDELCRLFEVPQECLPTILPNISDFGSIGTVPVTASIVDQQAALYGHGCREAGDAKITFGTGAFALAVTGQVVPRWAEKLGLLPTVAWDLGEGFFYAVDGGVSDAGSAVEWALRAGLVEDVDDLQDFTASPGIERNLVFVPAFSGLGCPWWDRSASPLMIGLRPDTTRSDIAQALLEGIALLTASVMDAVTSGLGSLERVSIDGGLSRSAYFAQFLADASGLTVEVDGFTERTAFGTAALAARAIGVDLAYRSGEKRIFLARRNDKRDWMETFNRALARSRNWCRIPD